MEIFGNLSSLQTRSGRPVIIGAGPNTQVAAFYRARAFEADKDLEDALASPEDKLGPPPSNRSKDGRMNARGISVFYGSSDPTVALAEVRPPVGSRVLVGRFDLIRPVQLLDLSALQEVDVDGSIFDPTYVRRLERAKFLERLSRRITIPVMPNDEPFEYLPTQAIADFLATEATPPLDGIVFPSVQAGAGHINIVLFYKAARVQPRDLPVGSEVTAQLVRSTEDGPEPHYWVWEAVPLTPRKAASTDHIRPWGWPDSADTLERDSREMTLKLDSRSLAVHHVKAVAFSTEQYQVERHQMTLLTSEESRSSAPDF